MDANEYIIDINSGGMPYNVRMILPLPLLQKILPLVREEMMKGLVSNDADERAILHLHLSADKILELEKLAATLHSNAKIRVVKTSS
jgi:hypothetical protein